MDDLCKCYEESEALYGDNLGYVTGLVNNNPWGFNQILDIFEKRQEFFDKYAREHWAGGQSYGSHRIYDKNEIHTGCCGTVWGNAYISRWVHEFTTMNPTEYINRTKNLRYAEVDNNKRYSINCMLFKKELWKNVDAGSHDDEHQFFLYCKNNNKKIIANLAIPLVHLMFFIQREENRTIIPDIKNVYNEFLNCIYPISICDKKLYEIENRLRFIEDKIAVKTL